MIWAYNHWQWHISFFFLFFLLIEPVLLFIQDILIMISSSLTLSTDYSQIFFIPPPTTGHPHISFFPNPRTPRSPSSTLTDTAPAILLQLVLGPALAAVLCHGELYTLMLAATVSQSAGADG